VHFRSELWRHPGADGWHFVTVPPEASDEIRARAAGRYRPFGFLPAEARIGGVTWRTSLFSDTTRAAYLLPVKTDIRIRFGEAAPAVALVQLVHARADTRSLGRRSSERCGLRRL
jgi:Domain of unknown function (DUF1905)